MTPRRNAVETRGRLLQAARNLFSEKGYSQVGIRDVAAAAGTNLALVIRYFGSKLQLFEEALETELGEPGFAQTDPRHFGRDVAAMLLDRHDRTSHPLPMLTLSFADPDARAVALRLVERLVLAPLARQLGGDKAEIRAAEILALTAGFSTYRLLLPLDPFKDSDDRSVRQWLERSLQAIADGREPN